MRHLNLSFLSISVLEEILVVTMAIKDMMARKRAAARPATTADSSNTSLSDVNTEKATQRDNSPVPFLTARTIFMAILVSMGGMVFGYDTGQISGNFSCLLYHDAWSI